MSEEARPGEGEWVVEPSVRARHVKSTLAFADELPEGPAIRTATPPRVLDGVEKASGMDWLPVGHDVALTRALFDVLGPTRHATFCTGHMLRAFKGPILGPLVKAGLALVGRDLPSMAPWLLRGWWLVFRDCGIWTVVPGGEAPEVGLRFTGVPEVCLAEPSWMRAVSHSMSALPVLAGVPGRITLEQILPEAREARYVLRESG
jgi:hypothetical protein